MALVNWLMLVTRRTRAPKLRVHTRRAGVTGIICLTCILVVPKSNLVVTNGDMNNMQIWKMITTIVWIASLPEMHRLLKKVTNEIKPTDATPSQALPEDYFSVQCPNSSTLCPGLNLPRKQWEEMCRLGVGRLFCACGDKVAVAEFENIGMDF